MIRGFASVLWGSILKDNQEMIDTLQERFGYTYEPDCMMANRMTKIERNIRSCAKQGYKDNLTAYVYGKDNEAYLNGFGIKTVLLSDSPYQYHPTRQIYHHKLFAYRQIMEDFDEVVFLDFDMILKTRLPDNFWAELNKRDVFQASLHGYRECRINHRQGKANKWIPGGAFVYMRDKTIPDSLIRLNNDGGNKWSIEPAFARLTDELSNGWKGFKEYWDRFEPQFYTSGRSPFKWDVEKYQKNLCFSHGHWTRNA